MSITLDVDTPAEFVASLDFEDESSRERALDALRDCLERNAKNSALDFDQQWIGDCFDLTTGELEILRLFVEAHAPELAVALAADLYVPTNKRETLSFRYVFDEGGADELNLHIRDVAAFEDAVARLTSLASNVDEDEKRETLLMTLDTFEKAAALAKGRSCLLSWSY